MYLLPNSEAARRIRLVVPLATFPVGCAAEAYGAYVTMVETMEDKNALALTGSYYWVKLGLLGMVLLINGLLGPTMAYPALLKKGLPVLLGKSGEKRTKRD